MSEHNGLYNMKFFKKHVLTDVKIVFDSTTRIDKPADYFMKPQIYQHFNTNPKDGIYVYSFSLNPSEYQPSGSCNFADIHRPRIYFKKNKISGYDSILKYNYKLFIYIVSYNIFSITNGIGNLKFPD